MLDRLKSLFFAAQDKVAATGDEIASIGGNRDITRGYVQPNQTLEPQDTILRTKSYQGLGGYDLFQDLLTDCSVFSALQQRRLAVISAETEVIPGGTKRIDKSTAAFVEELLQHIKWDRTCEKMHYGLFYGFAVAECLYGTDGNTVTLDAIKTRDRRRFAFDGEQRLRLKTMADMEPGEMLPDNKFWTFNSGTDHDDDPYGIGLAHWLYWPVLFKRSGVKFWLTSAEKFGAPTAVGWFPVGTSKPDQDKLLSTLGAIQRDAAIIMPEGMRAELLEAKRSAGGDYAELCAAMDTAISKIILSQMAPADSTASKLNVSAEEPPTWQRLIKADADLLCESFNDGPIRWLCDWNFPGAAYPKVWRRTEPGADLAQRSEIERRIFDIGYRPTLKQIQDTYDGEWEAVASTAPQLDTKKQQNTQPEFSDPLETAPTDPMVERLGQEAEPLLQNLLEPVRAALDSSADLMDFRERLLTLFPDLNASDFATLMGQALAVADAAGRWEVSSEAQ